jgi:hypothetical protein
MIENKDFVAAKITPQAIAESKNNTAGILLELLSGSGTDGSLFFCIMVAI